MVKKMLVYTALIFSLFVFSVNAQEAFQITLNEEFFVYSENSQEVAKSLGMNEKELKKYISENFIEYLAVNRDNTKQVKISSFETDFSNTVISLNNLTDSSITPLIPDITGFEGVGGNIITQNGQKFIEIQLKAEEEYILTQYVTVADRKNIVISFYTDINEDREYIDEVFKTLSSPLLNSESHQGINPIFKYIVLGIIILLSIACLIIGFTVVRDIIKTKKNKE